MGRAGDLTGADAIRQLLDAEVADLLPALQALYPIE